MVIVRQPSHQGLFPKNLIWRPINEKLTAKYERLIFKFSETWFEREGNDQSNLTGFYAIGYPYRFFVKVLATNTYEEELKIDLLTNKLASQGVNVQAPLTGFPRITNDKKHVVVAYNYLDHDFFGSDPQAQLSQIGKCLGELHNSMKKIQNDTVLGKFDVRHASDLRIRIKDLDALELSVKVKSFLKKTSDSLCDEDFALFYQNAQRIHADLHPGNIIFTKKLQKLFFLDFEDAVSSWGNPLSDVAMVIERCILMSDLSQRQKLVSLFIQSYCEIRLETRPIEGKHLYKLMLLNSFRSLIKLAALEETDRVQYFAEAEKFAKIIERVVNCRSIIEAGCSVPENL